MGQSLTIKNNYVSAPSAPIQHDRDPVAMLFHWAETRPKSTYLRQPINGVWREYSWAEVADQVRRMASALQALGLKPGEVVALTGKNTAHWIIADLAISMVGGISVGIYPNQASETTRYVLEHSETKFLFFGPLMDAQQLADGIPESVKTIGFPYPEVPETDYGWDALLKEHEPLQDWEPNDPDGVHTMIYTSGTTGNPKGVMLSTRATREIMGGVIDRLKLGDDERFFSYLPLSHIFERGVIELSSLYIGAEVSFMESLDKLASQLAEVAPTRFYGVPVVYGRIQHGILHKLPQKKLERLLRIPILSGMIRKKVVTGLGLQNARGVVSGAAPMPEAMINWFSKLGITICQGYGMSENAAYCTTNIPSENRIGSVGRPMPGVDIKIHDKTEEVLTRSTATMLGYYKNPEKTAETIVDGWLHTGDKGRIDKDGYLYITGRIKDAFKTSKGKYVDPSPIEDKLAVDEAIAQICLIGSGMKLPVGIVRIESDDSDADIAERLADKVEALNKTLEPHERVGKLFLTRDEWTVEDGLVTPTMKIKRPQLEERYRDHAEAMLGEEDKVIWL